MIITDYKPIGTTCGELIKKYNNKEIAYCGRLDPMAHGVITILTDNDLSLMEEYMKKNKIYRFKFIIGPNTDTDDILGIFVLDEKQSNIDFKTIIDYINDFPSEYKQKYHVFSSYKPKKKNDEGKRKALWWWTVNGYEIEDIPARRVKIYEKKISKIEAKKGSEIQKEFIKKIEMLKEDKFRKGETIQQWKNYEFNEIYQEFTCEFAVSSGFYIRQFVKDMSDKLKVKILVTDIERLDVF
jgi:tRNA pseudouridine(55) synthase